MEPTRCHYSAIFENALQFSWKILPAVILPLLTAGSFPDGKALLVLLAIPAILLAALLLQFLAWRKTWLSAGDDQLMIKSGLIWKKNEAIPYEKINTIDLSRNMVERVFGTCRIKIDTGAVTGGSKKGAEVNLIFTLAQAEKIRAQILALASGVPSLHEDVNDGAVAAPDSRIEVRARTSDFFLYGLTQNKAAGVIVLVFSAFTFFSEILGENFYDWAAANLADTWNRVSSWYVLLAALLALGLFLAFFVVANLVSVLYAVGRFYRFRASREADNIHIEYGLLTIKSYTIPVKNIHAVIVSQNLFRQWLKRCSVEMVSIGYGDEKNEVALLFPLISLDRLEPLIGQVLPEFKGQLQLEPAPPASLRRYLFVPVLTLLLAAGVAALFWPPVLLSLILLLPLLVLNRWKNYRNAGIGYTAERLEVRSGGFNRRRFRVRMADVQSVGAYSHPLIERAGLRNYRIDYHAPALRAIIKVRFLAASHLDRLRQLLDQSEGA